MKTIKQLLAAEGFKVDCSQLEELGYKSIWGTIAAEPYDVSPHHFEPRYRGVFVGSCVGGFYVTSSIHGKFRHYRQRHYNAYDGEVGNIFAGGKTKRQAVLNFIEKFRNKEYNVSR